MLHFSRKNDVRGFTLIELLVVIAIVGLLSSIILAALSVARNRGNDASMEQSLSNIRKQVEIADHENQNCYSATGNCGTGQANLACPNTTTPYTGSPNDTDSIFTDPKVVSILSVATQVGAQPNICTTNNGDTNYAIAVKLYSDPHTAFCVDALGNAKLEPLTSPGYAVGSAIVSKHCGP